MNEVIEILNKVKRIHFIGIGGSGMCPLAEILHAEGYELSGSDNNESDILKRIRNLGIPVYMGQRAENIKGAEMIVYTAALLKDNPELVAAKQSGIPTFERQKLFGAITSMYSNCICVAGTHGKTTVTSMLTQIMISAKKDPTAVIGGKLPLTDSYGVVGHSDNMVCEACEFVDTFLDLYPDVSVILNIDEDHLDYFKTFDNLKASFTKFANNATKAVIYNGDDKNTLDALKNVSDKEFVSFGLNKSNDYHAENVDSESSAFPSFDVFKGEDKLGHIDLSIPGEHNVFNALAAFASAHYTGVSPEEAIEAIEEFKGAGRRFEILGEFDGITIADDYAHHPKELEVTLKAAMKMGYNRVWAVFQPFTFSRTKMHFDEFVEVLKLPDRCVLTEIMGSREINTYGVYTSQLVEKIPGSIKLDSFEEIAKYATDNAEKGDLIITLGCGDIYKAAKIMVNILKNR